MKLDDRLRYRALQRKSTELYYAGRYEEAMECFNKSLEIEPIDKYAS